MKILHTTDLHFNKKWFEWISSQQNSFDIFCITGDFLESSKDESLVDQIQWVTNWMKNFKKPLFVCSGNHDIEDLDNEEWLNNISNIYADNSKATINGVKFGCVPYIAPDFFEYDECDVMLYHIPPANTKTSQHKTKKEEWGDRELFRVLNHKIIKPKYLLCGHLHHPISTIDRVQNTTIYNCGVDKKSTIPAHHILKI